MSRRDWATLVDFSPVQTIRPLRRSALPKARRICVVGLLALLGALDATWGAEPADPFPVFLLSRTLEVWPEKAAQADGDVELQRGDLRLKAQHLRYELPADLAVASGGVEILRNGNRYGGPYLELHPNRFEGFFIQPRYRFLRYGTGGSAERINFIDEQHVEATEASYTSCLVDGSGGPAWLLSSSRVRLDFAANEGVAEGAVLRFLGVPILAAPVLSFPLSDARKSGWLPPSVVLDSKGGLQFSMPYYWNIAPERDMTLTPMVSGKRGNGAQVEFRYREVASQGEARWDALPFDRLAGRARYALNLSQSAQWSDTTRWEINAQRVSDNDYWKDFRLNVPSLTPRLLSSQAQWTMALGEASAYARIQRWQVLQGTGSDAISSPYERVPQVGVRSETLWPRGLNFNWEAEVNRFQPSPDGSSSARPRGWRAHALGGLAWPYGNSGWTLTPRLSVNAASYALDQTSSGLRTQATRVIPSLSLDSAWTFERQTPWFGAVVRQTLEPRLLYANTPYRRQDDLPNFDSAPKDFNFDSVFSENSFSGIDRVSDAHQLTAGVTSRFLDPGTGTELLRLGIVQRYLFREQRITPNSDDPYSGVGDPLSRRLSDVLLLGSTTLVPSWTLDASVDYSPDLQRAVRTIVGARYSPGSFQTLHLGYRLNRGVNEQLELGWQWPLLGSAAGKSGSCGGRWYSVGRVNYSMLDGRLTDGLLGLEFDAGCWIGRIVAERTSTGNSQYSSRVMLQLELVGLSKLGSNPLQVLKDNIPGYRMLREATALPDTSSPHD